MSLSGGFERETRRVSPPSSGAGADFPSLPLSLQADTLLHGLMASGTLGAVSGLGNIAPHACVRVVKLFQEGKIAEAQKAQGELSMAGEIELKGGVPGMRVSFHRVLFRESEGEKRATKGEETRRDELTSFSSLNL